MKLWYVFTVQFYLAIKNEIMSFSFTQKSMQPEIVLASKLNQTGKDKSFVFSLICAS